VVPFGVRHVVKDVGIWMQPEPLLYLGMGNGDTAFPRNYSGVYAVGNPILFHDRTGTTPDEDWDNKVDDAQHMLGDLVSDVGRQMLDDTVRHITGGSIPIGGPSSGSGVSGTPSAAPSLSTARTPTEEILDGSTVERAAGRGRAEIRSRDGGAEQRSEDFESASGGEWTSSAGPRGTVRIGKNSEGRTLIERSSSSDPRPTLEIQGESGRPDTKVEIRYNED
jgi:hypothetical protein